jgi:hypothetical protein
MNKSQRIAVLAGLLAVAASAGASSIYSTSFELADGQAALSSGTFQTYDAGDPGFGGGWNVDGNANTGIDLVNNFVMAGSDGAQWVDLVGTPGPGGIDRTFNVTSGNTYTLTWDDFGNVGDTYNVNFGEANLTGQVGGSGWTGRSLSFTATTSGADTLSFFSPDGGNGNLGIDHLNIEAVPEPTTLAALGLGAIVLIGRRRRSRR